jgi:hypothetical protein
LGKAVALATAFIFRLHKFRNTSETHRLVALAIGNYAFGLRARFSLSFEISSSRVALYIFNFQLSIFNFALARLAPRTSLYTKEAMNQSTN